MGTSSQAKIYLSQLKVDLTQELQIDSLDYLVISGDIANRSTKEEYEAASVLVNGLKQDFCYCLLQRLKNYSKRRNEGFQVSEDFLLANISTLMHYSPHP